MRSSSPRIVGSTRTCSCRPASAASAKSGDVVVVEVVEQPSPQREAIVRVVEVLGSYTDPGMEIEIALRKHDLPHEFSAAAQKQADKLPKEVRAAEHKGRVDLTALPLVTIDGETAKDFDDAVYCERKGEGFRLIVAIADVSHYVRDGDALDRDARERGTSVYFPRRVIPMLPEALSNELCSLKPAVDRLCMACEMDVERVGRDHELQVLSGGDAFAGPAHLHAGLGLALATRKTAPRETKALLPHLEDLYALYHALKAAREARGAIDFDTRRDAARVRRPRQDRPRSCRSCATTRTS